MLCNIETARGKFPTNIDDSAEGRLPDVISSFSFDFDLSHALILAIILNACVPYRADHAELTSKADDHVSGRTPSITRQADLD